MFDAFRQKMQVAGCSSASIRSFERSFRHLTSGASSTLAEADLEPVTDLPRFSELARVEHAPYDQAVVIKLNGGLGTSMGLQGPKSLLHVRGGDTFLDLIARQILHLRQEHPGLRFLLMNSFSTEADTRAVLPEALGAPETLDFVQNQVPKVLLSDTTPLEWPENPELEWCPPGHGDLFVALQASGRLQELLDAGIRYAFVSNSDNLGATLDARILAWFAASDAPFLMEVTRRTTSDRKGGHLASMGGKLVLREAAMCAPEDEAHFQDIQRHRYFNTNNLWVRLDRLAELLEVHDGVLPLPIITNRKPADPRQPDSPRIVQLETAMGSALSCFEGAQAIEVDRSRFAPVKKTTDLLAVRSDAYRMTDDHRIVLDVPSPPRIDLDDALDQIDALDEAFPVAPSLRACTSLTVRGPVLVVPGTTFEGDVTIVNRSADTRTLPAGTYRDTTHEL